MKEKQETGQTFRETRASPCAFSHYY